MMLGCGQIQADVWPRFDFQAMYKPRICLSDKGEMTPTLKIKRSVIDEKYSEAIDEICGS